MCSMRASTSTYFEVAEVSQPERLIQQTSNEEVHTILLNHYRRCQLLPVQSFERLHVWVLPS